MKVVVSIPLLALMLSGCATQEFYNKPGLTKTSFDQDYAYCKLLGINAPRQETPVNVYTSHTITSGNYSTTTVGPDPYAQVGASLGDAIANSDREMTTRRLCMQAKGYTFEGER